MEVCVNSQLQLAVAGGQPPHLVLWLCHASYQNFGIPKMKFIEVS